MRVYVQRSPQLPRHNLQVWWSIRPVLPLKYYPGLPSILVSRALVPSYPNSETTTLASEIWLIEAFRAPCLNYHCLPHRTNTISFTVGIPRV